MNLLYLVEIGYEDMQFFVPTRYLLVILWIDYKLRLSRVVWSSQDIYTPDSQRLVPKGQRRDKTVSNRYALQLVAKMVQMLILFLYV
jgi:hypothetical protein